MRTLLAALLLLPLSSFAEVVTVDFVKILNGNAQEAAYYYENNWMVYRAAAKRAGVINSYELLIDRSASDGETLLLFTVYRDQQQYEAREANFAPIMSEASSLGPRLMNGVEPAEFRDVEYLGTFEPHGSSDDSP